MVRHFYLIYILCTSKYFIMYLFHPKQQVIVYFVIAFVPAFQYQYPILLDCCPHSGSPPSSTTPSNSCSKIDEGSGSQ